MFGICERVLSAASASTWPTMCLEEKQIPFSEMTTSSSLRDSQLPVPVFAGQAIMINFNVSSVQCPLLHTISPNPFVCPFVQYAHNKMRSTFLSVSGRCVCSWADIAIVLRLVHEYFLCFFVFRFANLVPPNIEDTLTSSDVVAREGTNVTLKCRATGSPTPSLKWKR